MALICVYIIGAYGYLTAKGFVFDGKDFILSNNAYAKEQAFSTRIKGSVNVDMRRLRSLGNVNAPLTMFAYSSMSCAHCREFHKYILPKLYKEFINTGKLRFVFVHFPIEPRSMRAAKLSHCLPKEKFYAFIDDLYDSKDWLFSESEEKLYEHAQKFGMTARDIRNCNDDKRLTSDILLLKEQARKDFEVTGTPSFIVVGRGGSEMIQGTKSYYQFKEYLEKRLKEGW